MGDGHTNAGVGDGRDLVSAGHEYVGGTRGSGIVSSAADVIWMSVVRGIRGIGEMGICLTRGGVGGEVVEWVR